jgi:carbonic anhydrase/acetyltransferase-like protein (isoleucine patch superfamily)
MILAYNNITPRIGENVFIAPNATIIGDVEIREGASIWYGCVLRGDLAPITVGSNSTIQDNCTVHTDFDRPAIIGNDVIVGHNAVVHGCTVEDKCLIGISAVILNTAWVKTGSVVAAGAVVREGQQVGPYHLVTGIPARFKKELPQTVVERFERSVDIYLDLAKEHARAIR